jgi:hypothetical protein
LDQTKLEAKKLAEILSFAGARRKAKSGEPGPKKRGVRKAVLQNKWGHWDLPPVPELIAGIKELEPIYSVLPHDAASLSKSLIEQFAARGQLSAKQWSCAVALLDQARTRSRLCTCPHCGGSVVIPNASAAHA